MRDVTSSLAWRSRALSTIFFLSLAACASSPDTNTPSNGSSGASTTTTVEVTQAPQSAPPESNPGGGPTQAQMRGRAPGSCARATQGTSPVAKACGRGGIKEAKVTMREMVRQAKAAGLRFNCDDCHTDDNDYSKITEDAPAKFEKLLGVYRAPQ